MTTKRRSHKNTPRLTAKERAVAVANESDAHDRCIPVIEKALQAHAREAVARYKRKHGTPENRHG